MSILLARPTSGRLKVRKLTDYALHIYASPDYLTRTARVEHPLDLRQHDVIGYVDDHIYSPALRYYEDIDPALIPTRCSSSILAQREMVRSGAGLALLPRFLGEGDDRLVPVLPEIIALKRSFWLAIHEDVASFARMRAMVDFLIDTVQLNKEVFVPIKGCGSSA